MPAGSFRRAFVLVVSLAGAACKEDDFTYLPAKPNLGKDTLCTSYWELAGTERWVSREGKRLEISSSLSLVDGTDRTTSHNLCGRVVGASEMRVEQLLLRNPKLPLLQRAKKGDYDYAVCTGSITRDRAVKPETLTVTLSGPVPGCSAFNGTFIASPAGPLAAAANADTPCGRYTACVCELHRAAVVAGKSSPFGESCTSAEALLRKGTPDDGFCEVGTKTMSESASGLGLPVPATCRATQVRPASSKDR